MFIREFTNHLYEGDVVDFAKATDPAKTPMTKVNKMLKQIGLKDYGVITNKPFDSKIYELLIDTYMNKVFSSPMDNKILDYIIKIYQKRGEKAKQLPPTVKNEEVDIDILPDMGPDFPVQKQDLKNIQSVISKEVPDIVPFNNQALTRQAQKDFPDTTPGIKKNCEIISSMVAKKYGLQNEKFLND